MAKIEFSDVDNNSSHSSLVGFSFQATLITAFKIFTVSSASSFSTSGSSANSSKMACSAGYRPFCLVLLLLGQ